MADERWIDALSGDPDLTPAKRDNVDALIRSTREELDHVDTMLGGRKKPAQPPKPEPFQPRIPEIYADLTLQDEEEPEESEPPRRRLATGWRVLIYVVSVLTASVLLAFFGWRWADDVLALTKPDREVSVTVTQDDTMEDIIDNLERQGLIEYPWLFRLYCTFSHAEEKIKPGAYELNNVYDYHALVSGMSGNTNRIVCSVTIPEGYTCEQIFTLLESSGVCQAADLYEAAAKLEFDYDFLAGLPAGEDNRLEGYLFPDTYEFYTAKPEVENINPYWTWPEGAIGDNPERVLGKFLDNFRRRFTDEMLDELDALNQRLRVSMAARGFTEAEIQAGQMDLRDVVIVASLIEKEAASAAEAGTISSVIYNRLCSKDYPLLEIDATVLYALGEHREVLTADDLMVDSPYNTRRYPGLPVGPIANPGLTSIQAALNPEDTPYYFYALDVDGTHHFSETYQEHDEFLASLEGGQ
ncbi:MAG: endolytic transglycosylase MltG [Oscillospiraceae bacterium]|nr:endolytic transglycosylase MltG [Oscillospiraceae bacterium]